MKSVSVRKLPLLAFLFLFCLFYIFFGMKGSGLSVEVCGCLYHGIITIIYQFV